MKRFTKFQLSVAIIAFLALLLLLVTPAIQGVGFMAMGYSTVFSGTITYNGGPIHIGFSGGNFTPFILLIVIIALTLSVAKTQKSTYFIDILIFITVIILEIMHDKFFLLSTSFAGSSAIIKSSAPYLAIIFSSFGIIACIFALVYKPDRRLNRKY